LVLVSVSVTDSANRPVPGLRREAFRLFEGRRERDVVHFWREEAPLSLGIVYDCSGSMTESSALARAAVRRFLELADPRDEFFAVEFDETARMTVPFTRDPASIWTRLSGRPSRGKTALLDAVFLALDYMKRAATSSRRAILVLSDGLENHSRYSGSALRELARESDSWIYALSARSQASVTLPEQEGALDPLLDLAQTSGGRRDFVRNAGELPAACERIALELRERYVLGFRPSPEGRDGKFHPIKVTVSVPRGWRVSSRQGYRAPAP
jgi:VWFA-related protein